MVTNYHKGMFPPDDHIEWSRLIPLLGPTAATIARYDGMLAAIPNPDILLSLLITQEAVLSSRIEGTQATIGEVLEYEAGGRVPDSVERREDINEVLNYRSAMSMARELLKELPLSQRVLCKAHAELLKGVRGKGKSPGQYRRISNWIGPPGCTIEEARFVPIGANRLPDAMGIWEKYLHADTPDQLVQLAVLHAEFESLHPFLDGNGRLGRMLIPLFMWQHDLISAPMFYISTYLEAHRDAYYDNLLAVSQDGDWTRWIEFFLGALRAQAEDNLQKTKGILDLYERMKTRVSEMTRSQHAIRVLDWIFKCPIFKSTDFRDAAGVPQPSAQRILRALRDGGILQVIVYPGGRRPAVLIFPELLNITEERELF